MKNRIKGFAKKMLMLAYKLTMDQKQVTYMQNGLKDGLKKQDQKYFNFSQLAYKLTLGQMQASNTIWAKEDFKWNKLGKWDTIKTQT